MRTEQFEQILATGSEDDIHEALTAIFELNSMILLGPLLRALAVMRDRNEIKLNIGTIRDHLAARQMVKISQRADLPEQALAPIKKYLLELPGYTEEDAIKGQIDNKTYEQHCCTATQVIVPRLNELYITGTSVNDIQTRDLLGDIEFHSLGFSPRERFLLRAIFSPLVVLRDAGEALTANRVRDHLGLDLIIELAKREDLPQQAREPTDEYLTQLPAFSWEDVEKGRINPKAYELHSYVSMQLRLVLDELAYKELKSVN